jgi:hypothetical protein
MDVGSSALEKMGMMLQRYLNLILCAFLVASCASKELKYAKKEELAKNDEFSKRVQIVIPEATTTATTTADSGKEPTTTTTTVPQKALKKSKKAKKSKSTKGSVVTRRQPEIESEKGFDGRRPLKDPFRVGEKIVLAVRYFKVSAGDVTLEARPFAQVNGRKNYQFRTTLKTSSVFSSFYSVNDHVDVLMDYEDMSPSVYELHVRETSQLREAQMFFDKEKKKAFFWEKKVSEKSGEETKRLEWDLPDFPQNVFSAIFYMRAFQWEVGQENAFYVANDQENLIFRGKALRKEKISTDAGDFDAIVVKPEFELKGQFKPTGDIYIWISDDDRKFILRIEAKIKIGTLVAEATEIVPGQ